VPGRIITACPDLAHHRCNGPTLLGHSSIVLTADTYTSVLPDLAHHAAETTARLILTSAGTTSRNIRNRHHRSDHQRPTTRPPRLTIPPQRSTLPSRQDDSLKDLSESADARETVMGPASLDRHHPM
jgi:hypothetical protein